ncbi:Proactivator polypeptide [Trichinella pseudospiralis]|uniref:Proactivator polypeptide n=1 Tax=Trichinella pseudospiralis TaxID=6337 RepID=A0A0V1E2K2_TRIPS|nr:Proactivator polypeptide [Trichinella pseudospiralis]
MCKAWNWMKRFPGLFEALHTLKHNYFMNAESYNTNIVREGHQIYFGIVLCVPLNMKEKENKDLVNERMDETSISSSLLVPVSDRVIKQEKKENEKSSSLNSNKSNVSAVANSARRCSQIQNKYEKSLSFMYNMAKMEKEHIEKKACSSLQCFAETYDRSECLHEYILQNVEKCDHIIDANRAVLEKALPEMKRVRIERERRNRIVSRSYQAALEEASERKLRWDTIIEQSAVIPPFGLPFRETCIAYKKVDLGEILKNRWEKYVNQWTKEELDVFAEKLKRYDKNFGVLALFFPDKKAEQVVQMYYMKKAELVDKKALNKMRKSAKRDDEGSYIYELPSAEEIDETLGFCVKNRLELAPDDATIFGSTCQICNQVVDKRLFGPVTRSRGAKGNASEKLICDACRVKEETKVPANPFPCQVKGCTSVNRQTRNKRSLPGRFFNLRPEDQKKLLDDLELTVGNVRMCGSCSMRISRRIDATLRSYKGQPKQVVESAETTTLSLEHCSPCMDTNMTVPVVPHSEDTFLQEIFNECNVKNSFHCDVQSENQPMAVVPTVSVLSTLENFKASVSRMDAAFFVPNRFASTNVTVDTSIQEYQHSTLVVQYEWNSYFAMAKSKMSKRKQLYVYDIQHAEYSVHLDVKNLNAELINWRSENMDAEITLNKLSLICPPFNVKRSSVMMKPVAVVKEAESPPPKLSDKKKKKAKSEKRTMKISDTTPASKIPRKYYPEELSDRKKRKLLAEAAIRAKKIFKQMTECENEGNEDENIALTYYPIRKPESVGFEIRENTYSISLNAPYELTESLATPSQFSVNQQNYPLMTPNSSFINQGMWNYNPVDMNSALFGQVQFSPGNPASVPLMHPYHYMAPSIFAPTQPGPSNLITGLPEVNQAPALLQNPYTNKLFQTCFHDVEDVAVMMKHVEKKLRDAVQISATCPNDVYNNTCVDSAAAVAVEIAAEGFNQGSKGKKLYMYSRLIEAQRAGTVAWILWLSPTNGIVITEEKADPDWYRTKKLMLETNSIPKIGRPLDNKITDGITVEMLPDELSWKLPPVSHGNNHTCELCKSYIIELRDIINDPEKLAQLKKLLKAACMAATQRIAECEAAVEGLDLILENMKESLENPESVCRKMYFCTNKEIPLCFRILFVEMRSRRLEKGVIRNPFKSVDVLCDECLFLTNEAASILSDEEYQRQLIQTAKGICRIIPQVKEECETAIDNYAPTLFQDLLDYLSNPKPVCQKIGFCSGANEIERTPLFPYGVVLNTDTEDALTNEVIEMCNHFSSDWSAQCSDFMKIYFKVFIQSILNNFNPTEACDRLHLCTISERRELMKMTPNQRRRLTCESCELMADYIMDDIEELEFEDQLSTELIRGCESMSFIKRHECYANVRSLMNKLMNYLKEELFTSKTCTKIGLCDDLVDEVQSTGTRSVTGCCH